MKAIKTGMEDSAWAEELEVPLSQRRFSKQYEHLWGKHTWRWINRLQEDSNREYQSGAGPCILYNYSEIRGIRVFGESRRLGIMTFIPGKAETIKAEPEKYFTTYRSIVSQCVILQALENISERFFPDKNKLLFCIVILPIDIFKNVQL